MKWILIALGILMLVVGAGCIASGYPVVEVERGWTLTIVGAIAATGGSLVLALSFCLIALESLIVRSRAVEPAVRRAASGPVPPAEEPATAAESQTLSEKFRSFSRPKGASPDGPLPGPLPAPPAAPLPASPRAPQARPPFEIGPTPRSAAAPLSVDSPPPQASQVSPPQTSLGAFDSASTVESAADAYPPPPLPPVLRSDRAQRWPSLRPLARSGAAPGAGAPALDEKAAMGGAGRFEGSDGPSRGRPKAPGKPFDAAEAHPLFEEAASKPDVLLAEIATSAPADESGSDFSKEIHKLFEQEAPPGGLPKEEVFRAETPAAEPVGPKVVLPHTPVEPEPPAENVAESKPVEEPVVAPPEPASLAFPIRALTLPRGPWPAAPPSAAVAAPAQPAPEPPPPEPEPVAPAAAIEEPAAAATAAVEKRSADPLLEDDDWFERALAGLDETFEQGLAEARAPVSTAVETQPMHRVDEFPAATKAPPALPRHETENAPTAHDPASDEAPHEIAATPAAPDERLEIGRYETEGTLYVMFADGSIDARTDGGVYRFESLAALKAHIETVA